MITYLKMIFYFRNWFFRSLFSVLDVCIRNFVDALLDLQFPILFLLIFFLSIHFECIYAFCLLFVFFFSSLWFFVAFFLVEWVLSTTFSSKPKEPSFSLNQSIYLLSRLMHFLFSKPFQFPWVIFCFRHISHSLWYAPKYTAWCDSFLFGLQQIRCADHWFRVVVFLRCFFSNFGSLNDIKW